MNYLNLSPEQFKRRFGVSYSTFEKMIEAVEQVDSSESTQMKRGPKPKLSLKSQILVTLEYWREYRTYFHIATSWGISESTVCRIYFRTRSLRPTKSSVC